MSLPIASDLIAQLVLARLLVAGEKGVTTTELRKGLEPLLGHRFAGAALAERLAQALSDLQSAGLAHWTKKGKTERAMATPKGECQALGFLGLDCLPPRSTWGQITKSYLAARALGLPAPRDKAVKQLSGDTGFKAALLKAQYNLPLDGYPTFDQALDALAWRLLGFAEASTVKFTVKAVKAALVQREFDGSSHADPKADPKKEAVKLLAKRVGARQSARNELRFAALRRWIDEVTATPVPVPAFVPPPHSDLDAFARRVIAAARASRSGRFGEDKVFVSHVFQVLRADPQFAAMGLDGFKRRLADANNARLLDLSRANMVEAMDPGDVERSRISYLGAEFHFVRIPTS
jgi:hypothetical protein